MTNTLSFCDQVFTMLACNAERGAGGHGKLLSLGSDEWRCVEKAQRLVKDALGAPTAAPADPQGQVPGNAINLQPGLSEEAVAEKVRWGIRRSRGRPSMPDADIENQVVAAIMALSASTGEGNQELTASVAKSALTPKRSSTDAEGH